MRTATAVWAISEDLVLALEEHLGPPVDSYVNGSQTWFTGEPVIEWRLHPVAGFRLPTDVSPYDLWDLVVGALSAGTESRPQRGPLAIGSAELTVAELWDGLECFPAYGDELEPAAVTQRAAELIPIPPSATGLVDHEAVGDAWERANGGVSIITLLEQQLHG